MFETKTEIINRLIKDNGYKRYLEIGVMNEANGFVHINCDKKVGVDPDQSCKTTHNITSDAYFASYNDKFDIILIDGLHEAHQVTKDIENSLKILNKGGVIVMHDCLPTSKEMQQVPRIAGEWTGDVWKAFVNARETHTDLDMFVANTDYGVGIITRAITPKKFTVGEELTYENFEKNKKEWLNLISKEELETIFTERKKSVEPLVLSIEEIKKEVPVAKKMLNSSYSEELSRIYNDCNEILCLASVLEEDFLSDDRVNVSFENKGLYGIMGVLNSKYVKPLFNVDVPEITRYKFSLVKNTVSKGDLLEESVEMAFDDKVKYIEDKIINLIENNISISFISNKISMLALEYMNEFNVEKSE
jgi:hypothetical protein